MKLKELFSAINPYEKKLYKPYVIAEAGVNHEGSMELAKRLCDEAKEGGADAIKFQTYKADTIASKDSPAYWDTTKIIVAQRISTIRHADKIIVLDRGEAVGMGTHEELMKNCDVYKEIALSQLSAAELA